MARQDYDWAIAVGQTLGYGCLFYICPALVSELMLIWAGVLLRLARGQRLL